MGFFDFFKRKEYLNVIGEKDLGNILYYGIFFEDHNKILKELL